MVAQLLRLQQPQQLLSTEPFPGQHLTHHPVHPPSTRGQALRPADPGHLFPPKPVADSTGRLPPPGTEQRDDASPPRCGSRTRPAPRHSSPSQTPFRSATGSRPRMPASPEECSRERWTGSSGMLVGLAFMVSMGTWRTLVCTPATSVVWPRECARGSMTNVYPGPTVIRARRRGKGLVGGALTIDDLQIPLPLPLTTVARTRGTFRAWNNQ